MSAKQGRRGFLRLAAGTAAGVIASAVPKSDLVPIEESAVFLEDMENPFSVEDTKDMMRAWWDLWDKKQALQAEKVKLVKNVGFWQERTEYWMGQQKWAWEYAMNRNRALESVIEENEQLLREVAAWRRIQEGGEIVSHEPELVDIDGGKYGLKSTEIVIEWEDPVDLRVYPQDQWVILKKVGEHYKTVWAPEESSLPSFQVVTES